MLSFEDTIWPLKNLEQLFTLIYLASKCHVGIEIDYITRTFNEVYQFEFTACDIENFLNKFIEFNSKGFVNKVKIVDEKLKIKSVLCGSIYSNCKFCQSKLVVKKDSSCVVFDKNEMKNGISLLKRFDVCKN
jgi:hypothetical protein